MGFSFSIRDSKISFYNLSNHKRELDAPQISHVTFPAIRYDVHFGLWLSVEVRFKNCFFGFRTALLGWTLIDSLTTIAYLALVARAWMYGCVSFSGFLRANCAVFYSLFLPLCILRRETNNHPNHCESTWKPHRLKDEWIEDGYMSFSLTSRHIQYKNVNKLSPCKSYISIGS